MKSLLIGLFALFPCMTLAQQSLTSSQRYEDLLSHFHEYVDGGELAGTVMFLQQDDQLFTDAYGYLDIESRLPMNTNSIFRIASMTKPLVAAAVMKLVEEGKLTLDDPVKNYLPAVGKMRVYDGSKKGKKARQTMTIRHLLSHTSGSTSSLDVSDAGQAASKILSGKTVQNLPGLAAAICETQLAFEPGTGWAYGYSNDLVAAVVEKVSRMSIDDYLHKHILAPLEMRHTSFHVSDPNTLTSVYATLPEGGIQVIGSRDNNRYVNGKNFGRGNGGLTSTAGDYLNFCQMIMNQGRFKGKQILQAESVKLMMQNVLAPEIQPMKVGGMELTGQGYGLGLGVVQQDSPFGTVGDVYWPGALYTYFFVSPTQNSIGIFMTQLQDPTRMGLVWEFHDLATKAWEKEELRPKK